RRARPVGAAALCPGALAPEPAGTPVVTLAELARFLRSPVGTFLAGRLGVRIPGADAPRGDDIETSLTGLERWRSAERLVRAVRSGHRAEDWARHERALGAIPPGGLGDLATGSIASAVGTLVALAESLGCDVLGSAEPSAEVDIWLEGGTRVVGTVPGGGSPERPGPASVTCTRPQPTHHLRDALDLAALVAADPAPSWRSVTVRRADRGEGADALVLEPVDDEPELRRAAAARLLEVVVDCYRRALREPVPLWPRISRAIYEGRARESDWRGRIDPREGDDARTRLAFGTLSLAEIRSAPARAGDPPGSAVGRADRFAHYLWEAVDSFAHPVASGAPTARAARGRPERAPRGAG
ncbi:MAG: hypothetical protein M0Z33_01080, partial [Actinomycetota bacterium]|nr:hypothetical protein [Actinomycetota bacterium]